MPLARSPSSSQPDLSRVQDFDYDDPISRSTSGRKRKQPDVDASITKALDTFMEKMEKMQLSLDEFRADVRTDLNSIRMDYKEVKQSLAATNIKQNELSATVSEVCATLDFCSDRQDKMEKRLEATEKYIHTRTKEPDMKTSLADLQSQLNDYQQRERINNLEILGLPEQDKENLTNIVITIARVCDVILTTDDIEHVNRVRPRQPVAGRPRAVIVKLKKRLHKDNIIAGVRKARGISTDDIELRGVSKQIYINEHLISYNKALLKKTREAASNKLYEYVWTKNCQILVRKNQGAPAVHIRTEEDLRKIQ